MPYLEILRRAGFIIYDPQTEEVVAADGEQDAVAAGYQASAGIVLPAMERTLREEESPHRRWWSFGSR